MAAKMVMERMGNDGDEAKYDGDDGPHYRNGRIPSNARPSSLKNTQR